MGHGRVGQGKGSKNREEGRGKGDIKKEAWHVWRGGEGTTW
jgi:hypothetical protein